LKLIVGLGNPGPKYQLTRHNIGFLFIDALVEVFGGSRSSYKSEFKAETQKLKIGDEQVIVCKPQTFMNLSGESVQPLMKFYNLTMRDLLVAQDEVDVPFGQMRFQVKRGHGGHNGIRNIHQMLGGDDYARLRLGVGRPPVYVNDAGEKVGNAMEVHEWVLNNFSKTEMNHMPEFMDLAIKGTEIWVAKGAAQAATEYNSKAVEIKG
jgi:PTH1 family peptidyl-tRNA hydrolase